MSEGAWVPIVVGTTGAGKGVESSFGVALLGEGFTGASSLQASGALHITASRSSPASAPMWGDEVEGHIREAFAWSEEVERLHGASLLSHRMDSTTRAIYV